jgi:hypothetical protein
MARMVGLSRARFYQLLGKTFPRPVTDEVSGRPCYPEELQRACLEVRRRNCGIDGKPVLFYARRTTPSVTRRPPKTKPPVQRDGLLAEVADAVRALGMTTVSDGQVGAVVRELYPTGLDGADMNQAIRAVFLALRRQDSGDIVGR